MGEVEDDPDSPELDKGAWRACVQRSGSGGGR